MSVPTEALVERLQGVRHIGRDQFVARCPGPLHENGDRNPSLSGRTTSDGRILLHCFAGCETSELLAAVGLTVSDLFPERIPHARSDSPNHWHARKEAFETIHRECLVVALAGETLAAGTPLSLEDRDRLCLAAQLIRSAIEVCR